MQQDRPILSPNNYELIILWQSTGMPRICRFIVTMVLCFCGGAAAAQKSNAVYNLPAPPPMTCNIAGRVIRVLHDKKADPGSICSKYPCYAMVLISRILACGSSAPVSLSAGDTVKIKFPYTLSPSAKVFPVSKMMLPGLKKGDRFTANLTQKLKPGSDVEMIVYGYTIIH